MPESPKPPKCWFCEHPGDWRITAEVFKTIDLSLTCQAHLHEPYWVQLEGFMRWSTPHYLSTGQVKVDHPSENHLPKVAFDPPMQKTQEEGTDDAGV